MVKNVILPILSFLFQEALLPPLLACVLLLKHLSNGARLKQVITGFQQLRRNPVFILFELRSWLLIKA